MDEESNTAPDSFLDLSGLINSHLAQIDSQKEQLGKLRDMLQGVYDSDPTYQTHNAAVKEATKVRSQTKKQIQKQPSVQDLIAKIGDSKAHIKDLTDTLSGYLDQYAKSGQTSIETPGGKVKQIIFVPKLVSVAKQLAETEQFALTSGLNLYEALLEKGLATDEKLGELISTALKVPLVDLTNLVIPESVASLIPERVARKHKVIAFFRDKNTLQIATSNPTQTDVFDILAKKTGAKIAVYFATDADVSHVLRSYKKDLQKVVDDLLKADVWGTSTELEDPPVAKIVDALIDTAYQERASDIHIEPQENRSLVRLRIDGMLQDVLSVPKYLHDRIITRIKVLSSLRTDEHLSAQDGKMRLQLEEENLDIRVSIVPVVDGEKSVLRLLSSRSREYSFVSLGMNESDLKKIANAYTKSFGMVLSTGPTGSGKTTSIYSILKILNTREKNITTVEDPVEYRIAGANQIQVNVKTNLTFANGLRSILRQDPNIIFVGEI